MHRTAIACAILVPLLLSACGPAHGTFAQRADTEQRRAASHPRLRSAGLASWPHSSASQGSTHPDAVQSAQSASRSVRRVEATSCVVRQLVCHDRPLENILLHGNHYMTKADKAVEITTIPRMAFGDQVRNRELRSILSCDTSGVVDQAAGEVLTKLELHLVVASQSGGTILNGGVDANDFKIALAHTFGDTPAPSLFDWDAQPLVDVVSPEYSFDSSTNDFVVTFDPSGEHPQSEAALEAVNLSGITQFRFAPLTPYPQNSRSDKLVFHTAGNPGASESVRLLFTVCFETTDTDGDGTPDATDACPLDASKAEGPGQCGCHAPETDSDGDGTADCNDACPDDATKAVDGGVCGCGAPDTDSDGDATADCNDACPDDATKVEDGGLCGCGVPDIDTDGDSTADCVDACPEDAAKAVDGGLCGCGVADDDTDGDGTPDCLDACSLDPLKAVDAGVCGCGVSDSAGSMDSDGDGVVDCEDDCPADDSKIEPGLCGCGTTDTDSDGDGTPDCLDGCPADPAKQASGVCGCGISDNDTDGDGTANCKDGCPADPSKVTHGQCGCDVLDTDTDSDGIADCNDSCANDPTKVLPETCGCGVPETDSDGDGTPDCVDACPSDPLKAEGGTCGCGVTDHDSDGDGTADCIDSCPRDAGKVSPGTCGCLIPEVDSDEDGTPDCVDPCPEDATNSCAVGAVVGNAPCTGGLYGVENGQIVWRDGFGLAVDSLPGHPTNLGDDLNDNSLAVVLSCDVSNLSPLAAGGSPTATFTLTSVRVDIPVDASASSGLSPCDDSLAWGPSLDMPTIVVDASSVFGQTEHLEPSDFEAVAQFPSAGTATCVDITAATGLPAKLVATLSPEASSCVDTASGAAKCQFRVRLEGAGSNGNGEADYLALNSREAVVRATWSEDGCPTDAAKVSPGTCGCGVVEDTGDLDEDGVLNCFDGCPNDPDKEAPGTCGCGVPEGSCIDDCPFDPNKDTVGVCGCGVPENSSDDDGDGIPNCLDACPEDPSEDCSASEIILDVPCYAGADGEKDGLMNGAKAWPFSTGNLALRVGDGRSNVPHGAAVSCNIGAVTNLASFSAINSATLILTRGGKSNRDPFVSPWVDGNPAVITVDLGTPFGAETELVPTDFAAEATMSDVSTEIVSSASAVEFAINSSAIALFSLGDETQFRVTCPVLANRVSDYAGFWGGESPNPPILRLAVQPRQRDCALQGDSDGDGSGACTDLCPSDPLKTHPGVCGCGRPEVEPVSESAAPSCFSAEEDIDGNGIPDTEQIPSAVLGHDGTCFHLGTYEVRLSTDTAPLDPYVNSTFTVLFTLPSGSTVEADGFYDGLNSSGDGTHVWLARAYCGEPGLHHWQVQQSSIPGLTGHTGSFLSTNQGRPANLHGKLRTHPADPTQFSFDDGTWFLHLGDTGYRYVVDTEPEWQAYIDQAVLDMGATKIRTWFARGRYDVSALFTEDRSALNLQYWQVIDERVRYALETYPDVQLQLIPYGEDDPEYERAAAGDPISVYVGKYAQARFSAYPNVQWCVINDRDVPDANRAVVPGFRAREPWGTLLTTHVPRFLGYDFVGEPWSDIVTLQSYDETEGQAVRAYRRIAPGQPVVMEEDYYEINMPSGYDHRLFQRQLMWANLMAGGHPTYGFARSYEPYGGCCSGVRGYKDLVDSGAVFDSAQDFVHIHTFFELSGETLVGKSFDLSNCGSNPSAALCALGPDSMVVYTTTQGPKALFINTPASDGSVTYSLQCFDTTTGQFFAAGNVVGGLSVAVSCDAVTSEDAVFWLRPL